MNEPAKDAIFYYLRENVNCLRYVQMISLQLILPATLTDLVALRGPVLCLSRPQPACHLLSACGSRQQHFLMAYPAGLFPHIAFC
jgi:hypothetical protein